jgi:DHA2 family multidrug resistance protein
MKGAHNPWIVAVVVTLATFMELLDTSIANVALPQMAGNLGVTRNESTWVLTSYLVANAVVIPMSGWLSNRLGRKRFYLTCIVLFSAASLLCGLAPTLELLVLCRVFQGLGGGGLVPTEQAILIDTFPVSKRGTALAVYGMTTVLAPALGPTLGGIITDRYSWRFIFFINVPVGILSFFLVKRFVLDPPRAEPAMAPETARAGGTDWTGLALIATGLGFLEYVLERGEEAGWFASGRIVLCTGFAVALLVAMALREWTWAAPILDLRLLARRNFAIANVLMMALSASAFGVTVLMPQYLWALLGYTPERAGLVLSPGGLLIFCLLPITGRFVSKVDPRILISIGFLAVGGATFYTARTINMEMDFGTAVRLRLLQCAGFAFLFVPIQMLAYAGMPPQKNNQAASVINLSRNLGASLGIAYVITVLFRHRQSHQAHIVTHTTGFDAPAMARLAELGQRFREGGLALDSVRRAGAMLYTDVLKQAMQLAYIDALTSLAAVAGFAAVFCWLARWPLAPR